mmetsp:Transcript_8822/g.29128  ORF Transcript_8822/g.29128 Transcript_8822/m.29128 type:complete len:184 (+) Transcript_8822:3111-3662(+)
MEVAARGIPCASLSRLFFFGALGAGGALRPACPLAPRRIHTAAPTLVLSGVPRVSLPSSTLRSPLTLRMTCALSTPRGLLSLRTHKPGCERVSVRLLLATHRDAALARRAHDAFPCSFGLPVARPVVALAALEEFALDLRLREAVADEHHTADARLALSPLRPEKAEHLRMYAMRDESARFSP